MCYQWKKYPFNSLFLLDYDLGKKYRLYFTNNKIEKIDEAIALCQNGEYLECYDKVLQDIKPKLTGLKVDEIGNTFGNGIFKNPWVIDPNLQQKFGKLTDSILTSLKDV